MLAFLALFMGCQDSNGPFSGAKGPSDLHGAWSCISDGVVQILSSANYVWTPYTYHDLVTDLDIDDKTATADGLCDNELSWKGDAGDEVVFPEQRCDFGALSLTIREGSLTLEDDGTASFYVRLTGSGLKAEYEGTCEPD